MNCNVCTSSSLDLVIALPNYPLNSLYLPEGGNENSRYNSRNLDIFVCRTCGHFQAMSSIGLSEFYNDDYNYNTHNAGVQGRIAFFLSQLKQVENTKFNRVIDIGCYDLSLLKAVKNKVKANYFIGVDPSIPNSCLTNETELICFKDYIDNVELPHFDKDLPDLIISDQTFEHIPSINSTLGNITEKVSPNSVFAVCVPSMEILIEKLNFHNLIHEHVNYFSVQSLTKLFSFHNLALKNHSLNYLSTCGFLFALFDKNETSGLVPSGVNVLDRSYFLKRFDLFKLLLDRTTEMISENTDEKMYGFGASDITANLAYFMASDFAFLTSILDDTDYKQGKYIPYLKPKIESPNSGMNLSDCTCLITSPQAARYLYNRINNFHFKRIINPLGLIA